MYHYMHFFTLAYLITSISSKFYSRSICQIYKNLSIGLLWLFMGDIFVSSGNHFSFSFLLSVCCFLLRLSEQKVHDAVAETPILNRSTAIGK